MPFVEEVWLDGSFLVIRFKDGRLLGSPVAWFPKLMNATDEQLRVYTVSPLGLHWPELDEDISLRGLLIGRSNQYGL